MVDRGEKMVDDKLKKQPSSSQKAISDETGLLDVRFILWRKFCSDCGLDVETLPSELSEQQREAWEKLKDSRLSSLE